MFKALISLFLIAGAAVIFFTESKNYFPEIKVLSKQASFYNETINTAKKERSSIDKKLEKSLPVVAVNSVKIGPGGQGDYLFSIEAVSYWRKTGDKTQ